MTSTDPNLARQQAEAFAKEHLVECASEIIRWQDSGLLPDGKLRELGEILKALDGSSYMRLAESFVSRAALASLEAAKQEPLTDEQITDWAESFIRQVAFNRPIAIQIAVEAAKWVRSKLAAAPSPGSGT